METIGNPRPRPEQIKDEVTMARRPMTIRPQFPALCLRRFGSSPPGLDSLVLSREWGHGSL